jgi:hypothetical protein
MSCHKARIFRTLCHVHDFVAGEPITAFLVRSRKRLRPWSRESGASERGLLRTGSGRILSRELRFLDAASEAHSPSAIAAILTQSG